MTEKERMDKLVTLLERGHFSTEFLAGKMATHCKEMSESMRDNAEIWLGIYTKRELDQRIEEYNKNYRDFLKLKAEIEGEFFC